MDARCEARTQAGKQCSRVGHHVSEQGALVCRQHLKPAVTTAIYDVEPWVAREMPEPQLERLRAHVIEKLRRKLKRGPRPATPRGLGRGRGGSIYVYRIIGDEIRDCYKVGMTSVRVEKRLQQWARKHKGASVLKVTEYTVCQDVAWVERVIHLYLDYCRVYRYPLAAGGLHSVWSATGETVPADNGTVRTTNGPLSPRALLATEKMIEWFAAPFEEIDAVIARVH